MMIAQADQDGFALPDVTITSAMSSRVSAPTIVRT
jgi:hypothetical protein